MTTRAPFPYEPPPEQDGARHQHGQGPGAPGEGREPRPRSRARRFIPLGVAVWALLEIWLLVLVGEAAGGLTVLALLVAGFVLGSLAIKRAGRRAWQNLTRSVQRAQAQAQGGEPQAEEEEEARRSGSGGNALAMLGGLLLMVPGLLSDVAGLLCLFPPTARLMRRSTQRYFGRREGFAPGTLGDAYQQARKAEEQVRMHRPDGKVVQGEVVRDDEPGNPPAGR
ncbi:FxsA family membrane protein [Streptomyces daliensis]|uniref:FxsA family protein n=1 Tax=Streptomyces daliensis TaxID=299421 RepID=A0A8T4ITL1_9ACTN|nr:FxsA family protein [Streptomyces daliensis]